MSLPSKKKLHNKRVCGQLMVKYVDMTCIKGQVHLPVYSMITVNERKSMDIYLGKNVMGNLYG